MMRNVICFIGVYALSVTALVHSLDMPKEELDKVIEDEITQKLSTDLLQSIERKFQVDLEKSVDMVLVKIKMLLQNGTTHIQDKLVELQGMLDIIKSEGEQEVDLCLHERQNETTALAEKALHQMVVCGYALIGHDPSQALTRVTGLKHMITQGIKPIYEKKKEIYDLLKVCGHDHETLKKVIKCVISKSTIIKSAMMDITSKLIEGVVDLTKLMAHGAMHEACLIEVIKTTEDEAFEIVKKVKLCAQGNASLEVEKYIAENNATVLDIIPQTRVKVNAEEDSTEKKSLERASAEKTSPEKASSKTVSAEVENATDMKAIIRRMFAQDKGQNLDKELKKKLTKLQGNLGSVDNNLISSAKKSDKTEK